MDETAYAKLNLALHVRAREPDGYHRIETLFAFCADGDRLRVEEGEGLTLRITGPFAEGLSAGEDNLVLRAARALAGRFGIDTATKGAAITLEKNLPVASGIGGGSADAAAALRLLSRWWGITDEAPSSVPAKAGTQPQQRNWAPAYAGAQPYLPPDLHEIARQLGADVPACLVSRTARGDGRGDRLRYVDLGLAGSPVLLVNPRIAVSTAAVFKAWDGFDKGPMPDNPKVGRNDLEPPARRIAPEIDDVLTLLGEQPDARLSRMSGSGATCFALFDNAASRDAASQAIGAVQPGWWRFASRLR
ncbi:MAG TPA: 4-(cytidine 5'-diphospho)-2-C-methyl-D-erythritol kinase [Allosphingosinicella sp.]